MILPEKNSDPVFIKKIKNTLKPTINNILLVDGNNIESNYVIYLTMSTILNSITYWFEKNKNININE